MPEFREFASIPRLSRGCVVSEKIDGTNAVVHVGEDGAVLAGSRNRWLVGDEKAGDNHGFRAWVREHADELRELGPGYHYGEWWGQGIQRGYGLTEKRWSLFNVGRWHRVGELPFLTKSADPRQPAKASSPAPACCHVVPVLSRGDFDMDPILRVLERLVIEGSAAAPGFMNPEGIVVYHEASGHLYKRTLGSDGHKGARR